MSMNFPIKKAQPKKIINKANLGMDLEQMINESNTYYLNNDIAVIHKNLLPSKLLRSITLCVVRQ